MKKVFVQMVIIAMTINVIAQSPQKMSYQAVIRNTSGALVVNHSVGMKVSILQGSATGAVIYSETYSPAKQTNANGLVTVEIGSGTPSTGTFSSINWANGPYFLKTETDPAGGTSYTLTGTSQLLSVPYALYAGSAANVFSGNYDDLTNKPTILNNTKGSTSTGYMALVSSTGFGSTAVGWQALYSNTSGSYNTAGGYESLYSNTSGYNNTGYGYEVLKKNNTGHGNTGYGYEALNSNTTGNYNTACGSMSLYNNSTGSGNTAYGIQALYSNTTGQYNTATGYTALGKNTGDYNTATGYDALSENTTGYTNTACGYQALQQTTSGDKNTALGALAGLSVTTGRNLTLIGYNAGPSTADAWNQITLGDGWVNSLRCNVQSITSLSDARDKKNITDLSLGLDFLMKLKPRQFNWDRRDWYPGNISDGSKTQSTISAGFIAQELDEAQKEVNAGWLSLVLDDNPERLEATPGNLLPVMVNAIQEQQREIDELKQLINRLLLK